MKIEVVNAGNCMACGKPIKLVVPIGYNKLLNVFFCRECESKLEYEQKKAETEAKNGNYRT